MQRSAWRYPALVCAIAFLLCGCSSLPKVDELYERPFCYLKAKWDRDKQKAYAGVSCRW